MGRTLVLHVSPFSPVARSPALLVFTCSPCKRALLTNPNPLIEQKLVFQTKPGFFVVVMWRTDGRTKISESTFEMPVLNIKLR